MSETDTPVSDGYAPDVLIPTPEACQARLDELWTATVARLAVGGLLFLRRNEVRRTHACVKVGAYRVPVIHKPTHRLVERAVWPALGKLIQEDAGLGVLPKPRQVLPVETPRVLEWTDAGSVVIFTRVLFFEVDAPRVVVAREVG